MITKKLRVYDLAVIIMYGETSRRWSWLVRTNDEDYQIELADGYHFVSQRGWADTELEALREATVYAVQVARLRVRAFRRRYLDNLCRIDLGRVVEEV